MNTLLHTWYSFLTWTRQDRGASLVEYTLLVALIALACFVAVGFLGEQTSAGIDSVQSGLE